MQRTSMKMYLLTDVSFSPNTTRVLEHVHFTQVGRAIHVDETSDILVCEVAEERDLAQDALGQRDFL